MPTHDVPPGLIEVYQIDLSAIGTSRNALWQALQLSLMA